MALETKVGGARFQGFGGGKGGGSARTPVETPDSLHSTSFARILDLLSEGEIYGPVHGVAGMARDVYMDGTPVGNEDGTLNFERVTLDFRAGTQNQDVIAGFPAAEATTGVGVELRFGVPWTQAITNRELSAVRLTLGVPSLSRANASNGDLGGYTVLYAIDVATDGGAFVEVLNTAFTGKTTSAYARTHRVELPPSASTGWVVRVRRMTVNADSALISDTTTVNTYTTVLDARLRYPLSAIMGVQIDAAQFQSIPTRSYHMRGRIIRVPTNYDPETRNYTGTWDGTFKLAYTDNPAWCFYDIVTNTRYGTGDRVPPAWVDRYALYQIGRYCDELVPDGRGGMEPRFTCFIYLQTAADAWKVLQDFASIFRGMAYYAAGSVITLADRPQDPRATYTQANVLGGKFTKSGSGSNVRYNVVKGSWLDMSDMGRAKMEVVQDDDDIARTGRIVETETVAFACKSQGQCQRMLRWIMVTSQLETQSIAFAIGMDGNSPFCRPGEIIRVADNALAGRTLGGRITSATINSITTDRPVAVAPGDTVTVMLPSGVTETRQVSRVVGESFTADTTEYTADSTMQTADMTGFQTLVREIVFTSNLSAVPQPEAVWVVESSDLVAQTYRVLSVTERKKGVEFEIAAVQHVAGKYEAVDYQTQIQLPPTTIVPPSVMPAPAYVTVEGFNRISQGVASQVAIISVAPVQGAVRYEVEWRRDNSDWVKVPTSGTPQFEVANIFAGGYVARARAVNALDVPSLWTYSVLTQLDGITVPPPTVTSLTTTGIVFGIGVRWTFPTGPYIFGLTEIWYSNVNDRSTAVKLGDFAYPQNTHTLMGLAAGATLYFWARLRDSNGLAGEFYPGGTTGVMGQSSANADAILEYLNEKITETQLAQSLLTKIEEGDGAMVEVEAIKSDLAAMYTIKTQLSSGGRTVLAGIGVGVENNQGIIESQVLVTADRFAVLHPNGSSTVTPFVIQGGQVFISQAFIGTGWITNAMIGNVIQSNNYVAGVSGWKLDKAGTFELNSPLPGGGRLVINPQQVIVYDANNIDRTLLGYIP